jgi:ATP sulfurylase
MMAFENSRFSVQVLITKYFSGTTHLFLYIPPLKIRFWSRRNNIGHTVKDNTADELKYCDCTGQSNQLSCSAGYAKQLNFSWGSLKILNCDKKINKTLLEKEKTKLLPQSKMQLKTSVYSLSLSLSLSPF